MVLFAVILTICVAIAIDLLFLRKPVPREVAESVPATIAGQATRAVAADFVDEIHYDKSHTWALIQKAAVPIGIDEFAQRFVGAIDRIDAPRPGAEIKKGEPLWTLRFGNRTVTQRSPISGRVSHVNIEIVRDPRLAGQLPMDQAWIVKIVPQSLQQELPGLLNRNDFKRWNDRMRARLLQEMLPELGAVYGDASEVRQGSAREIAPDKWERVAEFLFHNPD
jgi:glycine cleavage system H protein